MKLNLRIVWWMLRFNPQPEMFETFDCRKAQQVQARRTEQAPGRRPGGFDHKTTDECVAKLNLQTTAALSHDLLTFPTLNVPARPQNCE